MPTPSIEYHTIDKTTWPAGPWMDEPDKAQWTDPATGLPCIAVRHPRWGHWCGYVGVDETHRLYGDQGGDLDGHGGITFADVCNPDATESEGICHVPGDGDPAHVWWFGFDCLHWDDAAPLGPDEQLRRLGVGVGVMLPEAQHIPWGTYKTLAYVRETCAELAAELAALR